MADVTTPLGAVLLLLARNLIGWAQVSLDNYSDTEHGWRFWLAIDKYEWQKLASTFVRVGVMAGGIYGVLNLGAYGIEMDVDVFSSTLGAVVVDYIISVMRR